MAMHFFRVIMKSGFEQLNLVGGPNVCSDVKLLCLKCLKTELVSCYSERNVILLPEGYKADVFVSCASRLRDR